MVHVTLFVGDLNPLPQSKRLTGMYKSVVEHPIYLDVMGFEGDKQADLKVHGGIEKAVHLYPAEHYSKLAEKFKEIADKLIPGSLGENISTSDIDENDVRLGDIWKLGKAKLQVCQPRNPCWKIDERFETDGMAIYIAEHLLTGWYWRVIKPGIVTPEDCLMPDEIDEQQMTLRAAMQLWQEHRPNLSDLEKLSQSAGIAVGWRSKILQRLAYLKTNF